MKKNKGKISNINKKILALGLSFALIPTVFAGCTKDDDKPVNFEYATNEQGMYQMSGTIDYELLKKYCFIVVENSTSETKEYYICGKDERKYENRVVVRCFYKNIYDEKVVFDTNGETVRTIIFETELEDYLLAYDFVKANYTKEDIDLLFEQMKETYLELGNKQLIK